MGLEYLTQLYNDVWQMETTHLCNVQTFRQPDRSDDPEVNARLLSIRDDMDKAVTTFNNDHLSTIQLTRFQWCQHEDGTNYDPPTDEQIRNSKYWIFGYRFGAENPKRKIAIICHLDTVPAEKNDDWDPFNPVPIDKEYSYSTDQTFLVGRGCVDDKGPAVCALVVMRALAKELDGTDYMQNIQFEVIFDSSEEVDMSTPVYIESNREKYEPDVGIVFDAMWVVMAEKGLVRPSWTIDYVEPQGDGLYIETLTTPKDNSANTIPDEAVAVIKSNGASLDEFANSVAQAYMDYDFDDPDYIKAELNVSPSREGDAVILKTIVAGAQHGSAPEENRAKGANPLVSLANFLAGLATNGQLAANHCATMCKLIEWMWGTKVFGENHDALQKSDEVFTDGTTYAVTKTSMVDPADHSKEGTTIKLEIDIRYAIGHHIEEWDGESQGFIPGEGTTLSEDFPTLTGDFNDLHGSWASVNEPAVVWMVAPDIRKPDTNPDFLKVERAYTEVVGKPPNRYAIGGGTDAKGNLKLMAVGPLMAPQLGPPVNYHGIGEGAPMSDMLTSAKILYRSLELQVEDPTPMESAAMAMMKEKAYQRLMDLRNNGYKFCCSH